MKHTDDDRVRSPVLSWALAPTVVAAALALQQRGVLPSSGTLRLAAVAACAALVAAFCLRARAARAPGPRMRGAALAAARALLLAALALGVWTWAAALGQRGLQQRLAAADEGRDWQLVGVIDELPVRAAHGERFGFRVEGCMLPASASPDALQPGPAAEGVPSRPPGAAGCAVPDRLQLTWNGRGARAGAGPAAVLAPAQRWRLTVRLRRPHATVNPGAFDRELRWLEEGVGAIGTVRAGDIVEPAVRDARPTLERLRWSIRERMLQAGGPDRARDMGVLVALAIGDQAAIAAPLWTLFNQTGVGHLMSISGLHITMLAGMAGAVVGRAWRTRAAARLSLPDFVPAPTARLAAAAAAALAYSLLAGWGIPAQRTCWMLIVAALLLALGRGASIWAAVGAAAATVVLMDPWAPLAAGFWLSFGAVLAIVWISGGQRFGESRWRAAARAALRTQWAATVALVPLGALFFGSASLVGPLANAGAIPLVSIVVTPLALAGGALALLSADLAGWLLVPAAWMVGWLIQGLTVLAALPAASVPMIRPDPLSLACALLGCGLLLAPAGAPLRGLGVLACLPLACAPLQRPGPGQLWLTALDVGQGMAVVVETPQRVLVYDTGPTQGPGADAGGRVVAPYLRSRGYLSVDAVVVSHLDDDHSGGALSLLQGVPHGWLTSSLPPAHPIVHVANVHTPCRRGERWQWGEATFEWLHPPPSPETGHRSATNALSCVLRISSPAGVVLLAGDIESAQERRLLEVYPGDRLRSDVLLVPHHGSATSSSPGFIDAVAPAWAIFQVGYRSRFRHPNPKVLERYVQRGIGILRSDHDGALQIRLAAGQPATLHRARQDPARYWRIDAAGEGPPQRE